MKLGEAWRLGAFLVVALVFSGCADTPPRYPNMWGRVYFEPTGWDRILQLQNPDADFTREDPTFLVLEEGKPGDGWHATRQVGFFELNEQPRDPHQKLQLRDFYRTDQNFSNGLSMERHDVGLYEECYMGFTTRYVFTSGRLRKPKEVAFFYAPLSATETQEMRCEGEEPGSPRPDFDQLNFLDLRDGTILAWSQRGGYAVRFDRRLETPFTAGGALVQVEGARVDGMLAAVLAQGRDSPQARQREMARILGPALGPLSKAP